MSSAPDTLHPNGWPEGFEKNMTQQLKQLILHSEVASALSKRGTKEEMERDYDEAVRRLRAENIFLDHPPITDTDGRERYFSEAFHQTIQCDPYRVEAFRQTQICNLTIQLLMNQDLATHPEQYNIFRLATALAEAELARQNQTTRTPPTLSNSSPSLPDLLSLHPSSAITEINQRIPYTSPVTGEQIEWKVVDIGTSLRIGDWWELSAPGRETKKFCRGEVDEMLLNG